MESLRSPRRLGLAVAAFGVTAHTVMTFLVFTYPMQFLSRPEALAYLDAWMQPVATVGQGLVFYLTPVLALVGGSYLVHVDDRAPVAVLRGFVPGGVLFALGIGCVNWLVTSPQFRPAAEVMAGHLGQMTALFAVPAALAALVANGLDGDSSTPG